MCRWMAWGVQEEFPEASVPVVQAGADELRPFRPHVEAPRRERGERSGRPHA